MSGADIAMIRAIGTVGSEAASGRSSGRDA